MFDATRRLTSIIYLSCLAGTLFIVFLPLPRQIRSLKLPLLLLLMLVQFAASVWYTLSYIPYGRRTFTKCIKRQLGLAEPAPEYTIPTFSLTSLTGGGGGN
jgi:Got1/Sft2-like family